MKKIRLPEMIDYFRKQNGWTMKEFGEKMNKSESAISKWIKGVRSPMVDDFDKMVTLFETDPDTLMYGAKEKTILFRINNISSQLEEPRQEKVLTFAESELEKQTNSSIIDLTEKKEEYETLHVHGLESAGEGEWQDDDVEIEVRVPKNEIPEDYDDLAMVVGDSMRPKLHNGDILFIKFTKQIEIGEIGVFRTSRGNFVKKLQKGYLESLNYDYDDIYFDEHEECENIGVVVGYYRK